MTGFHHRIPPRLRLTIVLLMGLAAISIGVMLYYLPAFLAEELYPLPDQYVDSIKLASRETGLPPERIAATIRHESNWRPTAVSPGNARGLMQIIPTAGRGLFARNLPGTPFSIKQLEDPATNIRLGSLHLAGMHARYSGDAELALAGYNAGGGFADRFVRNKAGLARTAPGRYARRILSTEKIYSEVYGGTLSLDEQLTGGEGSENQVAAAFWNGVVDQVRSVAGLNP